MSASYQAKWSICYLSVAPAPRRRRFCTDSRVINMEFYGALSWWRTEANKPPYNQCRLPPTAADINQLTPASQHHWTGHTATQNWSFLPQPQPKPSPDVTAPTHGGMARLSGPQWFKKYWDGRLPKVATNPSTNRARCSLTLFTQPTPDHYAKPTLREWIAWPCGSPQQSSIESVQLPARQQHKLAYCIRALVFRVGSSGRKFR